MSGHPWETASKGLWRLLAVALVGLFLLAPALSLLSDFCLRVFEQLHHFGLS